MKSTDCGKKWSQPVVVGSVNDPQAPGVAFRTPTFAFVAADDTDPDIVYVAYQSLAGDYDIYVQRSTDGGATWGAAGAGERRSGSPAPDLPDDRGLERGAARGLVRLPEQRHGRKRGTRRLLRLHELRRQPPIRPSTQRRV